MNESGCIRSVTQTASGPVDHVEHIQTRYLHEQQQEVNRNDRSQRNPKFNPQPMGNLTPSTGTKVEHTGPKEPVIEDETISKELKKDLRKRNIK